MLGVSKKSLFARRVPEVEIVDGLVIIRPGDSHAEITTTPHVARLFVARVERALAVWEAKRAEVIPIKPDHAARS